VKGGDIIAYVMLRDRLDFVAACKRLGCWGEPASREDKLKLALELRERDEHRQRQDEYDRRRRDRRVAERNYLHSCERAYREVNRRLHKLGPDSSDSQVCWELLPFLLDEIRRSDKKYRRLAGLDEMQ